MRIAIIGSGISGLVCGWLLSRKHEITLYEADSRLGGHTNTVDFTAFDREWSADTGFMVFNDRTYPNFIRLLDILGVASQPSDMSFSVVNQASGLEYQGSSLNGLFAQRANLLHPQFLSMLREITRFNRLVSNQVSQVTGEAHETLGQFVQREGFQKAFVRNYLLPMTAAIWSAPASSVLDFPAKFLFRFFANHGLLQLRDRPQWRTISGGARSYIEKLTAGWADRIRLQSPVRHVSNRAAGVRIEGDAFSSQDYDAAVLACHAPDSLGMLSEPTTLENEVLSAFEYQSNEAVLHTDVSLLPSSKRAWASWNYRVTDNREQPPTVTYDLSRLQKLETPSPVCLTLNPAADIDQEFVLLRLNYSHPLYTGAALEAQQRRNALHKEGRLFYCGAYWGNGFHEDGVNSALAVCKTFGLSLEDGKPRNA
ncbi:NAD(P)/FAD-dependent oxidoreductase [Adhaeretor mobilis]|uniref:Protoporphyrinogen oxidase n=1 Tax=Adhaeretor mobilis TaxID=1930276 RepID=A0A517MT04_9BACT|nr:FAD-dependent oxidoreductase [Adhaeretor mobilis]QDS98014.1 protoporphyrinogen oxidase [Adhaeretor mobilis]